MILAYRKWHEGHGAVYMNTRIKRQNWAMSSIRGEVAGKLILRNAYAFNGRSYNRTCNGISFHTSQWFQYAESKTLLEEDSSFTINFPPGRFSRLCSLPGLFIFEKLVDRLKLSIFSSPCSRYESFSPVSTPAVHDYF
jgi:hypothetical protein